MVELVGRVHLSKQSLSRLLGELVDKGVIARRRGARDRRQRLLELAPKGAELERRLTEDQRALVARAYRAAGAEAVDGFRKVLLGFVGEQDRTRFQRPIQVARRQ
jgi:DNA-binding MarR family transcriptional regulator